MGFKPAQLVGLLLLALAASRLLLMTMWKSTGEGMGSAIGRGAGTAKAGVMEAIQHYRRATAQSELQDFRKGVTSPLATAPGLGGWDLKSQRCPYWAYENEFACDLEELACSSSQGA